MILERLGELSALAVLVAGPVPCCWSLLAGVRRETSERCAIATIAMGLSFWCSLQVILGIVLASAGELRRGPVLELELVLAGVGWFLCGRVKSPSESDGPLPSSTMCTAARGILLAAVVALLLTRVWMGTATLITNWDSLAYHLPVTSKWYQTGSLDYLAPFDPTARPMGDLGMAQIGCYPMNWGILSTLSMMPFRNDHLAGMINVVAWVLFGLSISLLCLQIGSSGILAVAAATLACCLPIVTRQLNSVQVDLALAAFFLASIGLALRPVRSLPPCHFMIFMVNIGMLIGIKTSDPFYAGLVILSR